MASGSRWSKSPVLSQYRKASRSQNSYGSLGGQISTPPRQIVAGEYVLVFHYWTGLTGMPHNDFHEFFIDDQTHVGLDQARTAKSPRAFDITLDKTIGPNRVMTGSESKSLLGF
jgi:hypothetical protein